MSVLPSRYRGGFVSFTAYSILLGLSYAYYARRARSIFWCTVSHCVHDALGLGGFVYMRWFTGLLARNPGAVRNLLRSNTLTPRTL